MVLSFPLFLFLSSPFLFLVCSKRELSCILKSQCYIHCIVLCTIYMYMYILYMCMYSMKEILHDIRARNDCYDLVCYVDLLT